MKSYIKNRIETLTARRKNRVSPCIFFECITQKRNKKKQLGDIIVGGCNPIVPKYKYPNVARAFVDVRGGSC